MTGELTFTLKEDLMTRKLILITVIVVSLFGLIYLTLGGSRSEPPPPALPAEPTATSASASGAAMGNPSDHPEAPDFTLLNLKGETVKLSALRGKVVIVNFWSTGCPPCVMELPTIEKLNEVMKGKPFQILTVTSDPKEALERAASQMGIKVPILLDANGRVADTYGVYYTPITFIIDMNGKVDQRFLGAANWADKTVIDYLNRLIAQGQTK